MKSKKIIIGSRGSKLALIYAAKAKEKILELSWVSETVGEMLKNVSEGATTPEDIEPGKGVQEDARRCARPGSGDLLTSQPGSTAGTNRSPRY